MNMTDDIVTELLRNALQLEPDVVLTDATPLAEIPNLDSLGQVRLVMEIEQLLDDRLSMDEVLSLGSVGSIRELLVAKGKLSVNG